MYIVVIFIEYRYFILRGDNYVTSVMCMHGSVRTT